MDLNGKTKTFDIISSTCENTNDQLNIYPNPVENELFIDLILTQNYLAGQLKIIDALGKIVFIQNIELNKGHQVIHLPINLEPGAYTLLFYSEQLSFAPQKFIVR